MTEDELSIGDSVVLVSGGPKMTVRSFQLNSRVVCTYWRDDIAEEELISLFSATSLRPFPRDINPF